MYQSRLAWIDDPHEWCASIKSSALPRILDPEQVGYPLHHTSLATIFRALSARCCVTQLA